jgi:hypothetical protein
MFVCVCERERHKFLKVVTLKIVVMWDLTYYLAGRYTLQSVTFQQIVICIFVIFLHTKLNTYSFACLLDIIVLLFTFFCNKVFIRFENALP